MAHQENWYIALVLIQLSFDHGGDVGQYGRRGAGEPTGRWRSDGATPSSLIKAECLDSTRGECWEQGVVSIDVIGETVYENQNGRWGEVRGLVRISIYALINSWWLTNFPSFCVQSGTVW